MPLVLNPGSTITVKGPGGKDVGAISTSVTMPSAVTWTNRDQINTVDRSSALTLTWTGGNSSQMLIIAGGAADPSAQNAGGFYCLAPATAGTFTVPVSNLANIPQTRPLTGGPTDTFGVIALISVPQGNPPQFNASGLTSGFVIPGTATLKTVQVK
jgi:hypothetical protein